MEKTIEQNPKKRWWRWGTNRWIVLALIILGVISVRYFTPISPIVTLPAEHWMEHPLFTLPVIGEFYLTNTMVAMVLVDIIVVLIAYFFNRAVKKGNLVLKGLPGALEALLEYLYNMTESTAGKWAWTIFPWFATITLLVLVANWMELVPGVDSIGIVEGVENGAGYALQHIGPLLIINKPALETGGYAIISFVRTLSTDLNFTVALALVAVIAVQVVGVRAHGISYFTKFWNVKTFFKKPIFGVIDWGVGLLELVSEFSKILSFAFRLFGNLFAGTVLLFVMGSLLGMIAIVPSMFYMLEFFVGAIQAIVFGLLTMTFMAQATQGHGQHEAAH